MRLGVGLTCFAGGARIARARSLRPYVGAPLAVSFVVIVAIVAIGHAALQDLRTWFEALTPDWLGGVLLPVFYVPARLLSDQRDLFEGTRLLANFRGPLAGSSLARFVPETGL